MQTYPVSAQAQWSGQRVGQNGDPRGPGSSNWRSTAAPPAQQGRRNSGTFGNRARFVPECFNCGQPAGSRYDPMNPHKLFPKPRKANLPGPDLMDAGDLAQRLMDAKSRMRKKITKPLRDVVNNLVVGGFRDRIMEEGSLSSSRRLV